MTPQELIAKWMAGEVPHWFCRPAGECRVTECWHTDQGCGWIHGAGEHETVG